MPTRPSGLPRPAPPPTALRSLRAGGLSAAVILGALFGGPSALADKPRPAAEKSAPTAPAPTTAPADKGTPEKAGPSGSPAPAGVVATEEGKEGVKTYKFGAVEVEGRLRSPQLIYFLRRVRAEFDASELGHRSFLRELSETRRHPAFR